MGRTTSTQRGASRRTTSTTASRGGSTRRAPSKGTPVAKRGSKAAPRKTASKKRVDLRPAGPWVPVAAIALVVVLGWSLYPALRLQYQTSRRAATLEEQYRSLKSRNAALSAEVAALKTPEGVAKAAREKLGYTKTGDNVYVVVPDGSAPSSGVATASMAGGSGDSIVQTVLDAVFGVSAPASPGIEP